MDINVDEQVHLIEQFLKDIQLPLEYPTNISHPSHPAQPQGLLANSHFSPLPSPATAERLALPTGHLPCGSLRTPSATATVDFTMVSNPGSCQSGWSTTSSNSAYQTHASVPNQHQTPYEPVCGWSRDFEPHPVSSAPSAIQSNPQPLFPAFTHPYPNVGQYDAWMRHVLDGNMDTCTSPNADNSLSASGFPGVYADHGLLPDARADPQTSIALTHDAHMSSIQPAAFPSNLPTRETYFQVRFFGCHWLNPDGTLCETPVSADRRSVVAHLQHVHGIKPGEEKARETCLWEQCGTILNKESLARHILTVHLKERVSCAECGLFFAREDSLKRHLKGGQHKVPRDKDATRQRSRNHVGSR